MMKKLFALLLLTVSTSGLAAPAAVMYCGQALPTNHAGFCPTFKKEAICHCTSRGIPAGLCQNMEKLYKRMVAIFGSLERACAYQKDTDTQTCIDDWNCYRLGGKDSQGRMCSSTGNRCEA